MEAISRPDGDTLYLAREDGKRGSKGAFFTVYADPEAGQRWGFFCSNCESVETAADSMGRIECTKCHNLTKAEEWDAAHE